ncbi:PEP/pyruvate-binding domain-containing protein [Chondromyces crocatus]|uniref:Pyruvate phosphate dikinase n=1 Tax=Chondromyces crocatus TaxID=52 RepID=A0A0K1ELE9_CHOCO|nr:PEP/pyruvate-binding domain-containing protein [Chondromyces crocatus]AKT41502.1 pyruvate phosphate dikinase [Chondromyces crocatus]
MAPPICFFRDLTTALSPLAGGKGSTLARLSRAGYPIPDGFIVLTRAFDGDALTPTARSRLRPALAFLRANQRDCAFAVRSSAVNEDSAQASFAGALDTVLDVRDDDAVADAIETVRRSRHHERVAAYSQAQGLPAQQDVAVVVQRLVRPQIAGVLFTADPVTGSRDTLVGNYVHGFGEPLVAGEATALAFTLTRPHGDYTGPEALRPHARELHRLGTRLEDELAAPQDIEWALVDDQLTLLQARPITTLRAHDPITGVWNDSLTGDYLWTSTNLGEAVPDVMTPCTWSLLQIFLADTLPILHFRGLTPAGNIGGRPYLNLSVAATLSHAFGISPRRFSALASLVFGRLPPGVEIPLLPIPRWPILRALLPEVVRLQRRVREHHRLLPAFVAEGPARCDDLRARIQDTTRPADLLTLWSDDLLPYFRLCSRMLEAGARHESKQSMALRLALRALVGEADTNALLSNLGAHDSPLESLGPLVSLTQLTRGTIDRARYARRHGHRGPHEFEVSLPRPAEDPRFIDRQLDALRDAPLDVDVLLARQAQAHADAWTRLEQRHPHLAAPLRHRLDRAARGARDRELARSEAVRVFWPLRTFVLRAGELTAHGDDLFFLSIDEILALLRGDLTPLARIPPRRDAHARQSALPPYPPLVRGRFDPFQWAADPRRRNDLFDARGDLTPPPHAITGFPGAAGIVEGHARVLTTHDDAHLLQRGEILVTPVTNIGWTPLFPRAAAIVTDVGAPLSHAAIVARELGIPAVVGCGNATTRLRTGDRIRVNGAQGTVERLDP